MYETPNCHISVSPGVGTYSTNVIPPAGFSCRWVRIRVVGASVDDQLARCDEFKLELVRGSDIVVRLDALVALDSVVVPASMPFDGDEEMIIRAVRSVAGPAFTLRIISVPECT